MTASAEYQLQPEYIHKFSSRKAKAIIQQVLAEKLQGSQYHPDNTSQWSREIADRIKELLKEQDWPRYKYVVQVVIGEQKGEGVKMGCRCFWDANTDNYADAVFSNGNLFCVAAAYGVYLY